MHRPSSQTSPLLHGVNPQAVVNAIAKRSERWRGGDRADDGRKIGLVIEGGGMRGVLSGGGAVVLGQLGFTDLFDEVYATSAGAMNAAYFLSHQGELGITIYYENLTGRRFLNLFRLWKVLDVDYVFDHVVTVAKPLDVGRILAGRPAFFVAVMDKLTAEGRIIDVKNSTTPLLDILKAATAIPVLYNRTISVDGNQCMDGGLKIPFPIEHAIARGCTDLLVLLTRPPEYICPRPDLFSRFMFGTICSRQNRGLYSAFANHHDRETTTRDLAAGRAAVPAGVRIATICPDPPAIIGRTSVNGDALREAAVAYGRKTLRIFGADADAWDLAPIRSK